MSTPSHVRKASLGRVAALTTLVVLGGCGGGGGSDSPTPAPPRPALLVCDETLKTAFAPDANTTVVLAKAYLKGEPLALAATPSAPVPPLAPDDVCLVKLIVGPGHSGPTGAPSTSAGIGIEIWLPSAVAWNHRVHAKGGAGWAGGGAYGSTLAIGDVSAGLAAASEHAVTVTSDAGHAVTDGSFAMNPDGTINTPLWTDFAQRAGHEMATKAKALAAGYYGASAAYAYWEGCSTGGRQGLMEAQAYPGDFDGILAGAPAINWSSFTTGAMYPQIVMNRETGGPIPEAKQTTAGVAAIGACDQGLTGTHDGYLNDPAACRYDPTADPRVLCMSSGGTNTTAGCLTTTEARVFNKLWYGQTVDGSAPSPTVDNGYHATLSPGQLWFGATRGTNLIGLAGAAPVDIGSDELALELQDPAYATPSFRNATGNGADRWRTLGYSGPNSIADAGARGLSLNASFGGINTDNPDLSGFRDRGGKLMVYHGLADTLIPPQGSIRYFKTTTDVMGGTEAVQAFDRLFLVPGMGHCAGVGSLDTGNPSANPPTPAPGQLFAVLVEWVEKGVAPTTIPVSTTAGAPRIRPLCLYPNTLTYLGGDVNVACSFACR